MNINKNRKREITSLFLVIGLIFYILFLLGEINFLLPRSYLMFGFYNAIYIYVVWIDISKRVTNRLNISRTAFVIMAQVFCIVFIFNVVVLEIMVCVLWGLILIFLMLSTLRSSNYQIEEDVHFISSRKSYLLWLSIVLIYSFMKIDIVLFGILGLTFLFSMFEVLEYYSSSRIKFIIINLIIILASFFISTVSIIDNENFNVNFNILAILGTIAIITILSKIDNKNYKKVKGFHNAIYKDGYDELK